MLELRPLVLEEVQVESEDVELLGREGGGVSEGGKCFDEKETKRKGKGKLKG